MRKCRCSAVRADGEVTFWRSRTRPANAPEEHRQQRILRLFASRDNLGSITQLDYYWPEAVTAPSTDIVCICICICIRRVPSTAFLPQKDLGALNPTWAHLHSSQTSSITSRKVCLVLSHPNSPGKIFGRNARKWVVNCVLILVFGGLFFSTISRSKEDDKPNNSGKKRVFLRELGVTRESPFGFVWVQTLVYLGLFQQMGEGSRPTFA
jgi:hypothetical protein